MSASISQAGSLNPTALVVPNLYINVQTPTLLSLNGVPTNVLGIVGSASWGPLNTPLTFGGIPTALFGSPRPRKYDMATHVATALLQGAGAFVGVRVSDGTDTDATGLLAPATGNASWGATVTALYSGTYGNGVTFYVQPSSIGAGFVDAVAYNPSTGVPEQWTGIPASTPALFWPNLIAAVNGAAVAGWIPNRGASVSVVLSLGTGAASIPVPTAQVSVALIGGTDGAAGVGASQLIGTNTAAAPTGMYCLQKQGVTIGVLADLDTSTTWTTQVAFGLAFGIYMICTGPSGDTVGNAITTKQAAGLASTAAKLMFGDWLAWFDTYNGITRFVSPQGFAAGLLANLSPEQSSLNKQIAGIAYSQKSGTATSTLTYSDAQLQALVGAGIDVITNPAPGGAYWACRSGHNTSNNVAVYNDAWTRLTDYISSTLAAGMGIYVGQPINAGLFANITSTLLGYLGGLLNAGQIALVGGNIPYSVVCNSSNNPQSATSLGYVTANVQVTYQGINEKFVVNLLGGATVQVTVASTSSASS